METLKMKKILFVLCICCTINCMAQKPSGVYWDEKSNIFFAIKNDSISIGYGEPFAPGSQSSFYYGNYKFDDGEMKLCQNLLNGENAIVESDYVDFEGVEIVGYSLVRNFSMGAQLNKDDIQLFYCPARKVRACIDVDDTISELDILRLKELLYSEDGIIRISKEMIDELNNSTVNCWIDCFDYTAILSMEMKPHTRYSIKQLYVSDFPLDINQILIIYSKDNDTIYVTPSIYWSTEGFPLHHLKRVRDCKSCLGELRKHYPKILNRNENDVEWVSKMPIYESIFNQVEINR